MLDWNILILVFMISYSRLLWTYKSSTDTNCQPTQKIEGNQSQQMRGYYWLRSYLSCIKDAQSHSYQSFILQGNYRYSHLSHLQLTASFEIYQFIKMLAFNRWLHYLPILEAVTARVPGFEYFWINIYFCEHLTDNSLSLVAMRLRKLKRL